MPTTENDTDIQNEIGSSVDSYPSLEKILKVSNVADILEESHLDEVSLRVVNVYEADSKSREPWMKSRKEAMELAQLVTKKKTFPWPGAANIKYPLLTTAAIQFGARSSSAVFEGDKPVKIKVIGEDKDQVKKERSERVSSHMSYQLTDEMEEWEPSHDRLLHILPIVDTCFKKTYFSAVKQRNVSELRLPSDLVINYWSNPDEDPRTATDKIYLYKNAVLERIGAGTFIKHSEILESLTGRDEDDSTANEIGAAKEDDHASPIELFLEQHGWFDLDGDGYEEPYVITVHKETKKVVRISKRYEEDDVKRGGDGDIINIVDYCYFTKYDFMPSLDGSYYGNGFGALLLPINEGVNVLFNQLLDSGALSNLGGGFVGRGARMKAGVIKVRMGQWIPVDVVSGNKLRDNLFPLPVNEPSRVLLDLALAFLDAGKELGSVAEVLTGQAPAANTSPTTVLALIEQGTQVYSNILKRVFRAQKKEYKKLFHLNSVYLKPQEYFTFLDEERAVTLDDYNEGDLDIAPVADPKIVSRQQKLAVAEALFQTMGVVAQTDKDKAILRIYYETVAPNLVDEIMPKEEEGGQQPPTPEEQAAQAQTQAEQQKLEMEQQKLQIEQQKLQLAQQKQQVDQQMQQQKLQTEIEKIQADIGKSQVEAEAKSLEAAAKQEVLQVEADGRQTETEAKAIETALKQKESQAAIEKVNAEIALIMAKIEETKEKTEVIEKNESSDD